MKIIVHECLRHEKLERREWITKELKLPIHKEEEYHPNALIDICFFYIVVMNEEDLSHLRLKYPVGTFKNL